MKHHSLIIILLAAIGGMGCSSSTTWSRAEAHRLADTVAAYREEQSDRVNRLNNSFNDSYKQLNQSLDDISGQQLLIDRDDEAQRIADKLITSSDASMRQTFRDAFRTIEQGDLKAMLDSDAAVEAAKTAYQTAYKNTAVPLDKLRKAEQDLRGLTEKEDEEKDAIALIQKLFSAYQSLSKTTNQNKSTTPTASSTASAKT